MGQKIAAVLAHRAEVERGAVPGLIACLPPDARERLSTEWYIRNTLLRQRQAKGCPAMFLRSGVAGRC